MPRVSAHKPAHLKPIPIEEYSAGGVVFRKTQNGYEFVLIKDGYRKWTFPKGRIEKGETPESAALAEVEEEAGIREPKIVGKVSSIVLTLHPKGARAHKKKVYFFLIKTNSASIEKEHNKPSVLDARWVRQADVSRMLGYQNMKSLFSQALEIIRSLE